MAGFDNEVLYCIGERLQASSAQAVYLMQKLASDVSRINHTGSPSGAVSANPSSLCHDPVSGKVYIKVLGTGSAGWSPIFPVADGQLIIGSALGLPTASTLTAGAGIGITNGSNSITISNTAGGFSWHEVTSVLPANPIATVSQNGYIAKGAVSVAFILPAAAAVGDTFQIAGYGNFWTLSQNAGQKIFLGDKTSTPGVAGSISATQIKDTVQVICVTENVEFHVLSLVGNILIV